MKSHTVQLNLEDFDNGTSDLSSLEFGIYTRLFLASYTKDLPDDDEKLARIARCKISEIRKCRKIIDAKFYKSENFLKNSRTEKEAAEAIVKILNETEEDEDNFEVIEKKIVSAIVRGEIPHVQINY